MKASHGFGVTFGGLLGDFFVPRHGVGKIIGIDKVVAGVVGRVNIDHPDLAVISGLQEFQDLQIVAFYVEVLCLVKVDALLGTGPQRAGGALLRQFQALRLALPLKFVFFKVVVDIFTTKG